MYGPLACYLMGVGADIEGKYTIMGQDVANDIDGMVGCECFQLRAQRLLKLSAMGAQLINSPLVLGNRSRCELLQCIVQITNDLML